MTILDAVRFQEMNSNDMLFQLTNVGSSPIHKNEPPQVTLSNNSSPRRWTELFSKKKVKTPPTGSPSTIRSNNYSDYQNSPSISSLPHSSGVLEGSSGLFQDTNNTPLVRPVRSNGKCWKNEPCCICSDLCCFKGSVERVVQLQCKHICHEDCLMVGVDICGSFKNLHDALPKCVFCQLACIPKDAETKEKIRMHLLSASASSEPISQPGIKLGSFNLDPPAQMSSDECQNPRTTTGQLRRDKEILKLSRYSRRHSNFRGSTISGVSSIISSSSHTDKSLPPLHVQRQYFMQGFFTSFLDMEPWEIDSKYGLLRLVDDFFISLGDSFKHYICYLFREYMIICKPTSSEQMPFTQYSSYQIFQLKKPASIHLLDSKTLEISFVNDENLKMKQYGDDSQPLEKWITAFFDPLLCFGKFDFTSIKVPHFLSALAQASGSATNLSRRKSVNGTRKLASIHESNVLTSVSSILSLRKSKPEDLAVILQIDRRKVDDANLHTIMNLLRILSWKFSSVNCCVVDEKKNILNIDKVLRVVDSWNELTEISCEFSPRYVYEQFYERGGNRCKSSGVLVVSNSSMELKKSCLFENYDCFANSGRRHVYDLKIKVGFLNHDYSEHIQELVEVENWGGLLEVIAYAFNLNFDDLDEDSRSDTTDDENSITSQESGTDLDASTTSSSANGSHIPTDSAELQSLKSPSNIHSCEYSKNGGTYHYL